MNAYLKRKHVGLLKESESESPRRLTAARRSVQPLPGKMNPAETFRLSVTERLEAAAEEIFLLFHRSVAQYEEEIARQRRLLDVALKPHIKLQRTELRQQHVYQEEPRQQNHPEVEPEPPMIEEEQQQQEEELEDPFKIEVTEDEILREQQLWRQGRNPEVTPQPPVMEEELQGGKQEPDDVPVSWSHDGSKDVPALWSPDGRVDAVPESDPAAEGHQYQPPTGPADKAAVSAELQQQHVYQDEQRQQQHLEVEAEPPMMEEEQQQQEEELEEPFKIEVTEDEVLWEQQPWGQPPVMEEEELWGGKQEPDDIPVSWSYDGSKDVPALWSPDGRVDAVPESDSAAEGHQYQPPTGPADKAAGLKEGHLCHTCGKKFRHSSALKEHIRTHTGEKPYSCKFCEQCFALRSTLRQHMRIHTGKHLKQCRFCGKQFTRSESLKDHERRHTGEKPHSCKDCGKLFTTKRERRTHMRVHTGETPYVCKICGKGFRWATSLILHRKGICSGQAQSDQSIGGSS